MSVRPLLLVVTALALTGCQATTPKPASSGKSAGLRAMEQVAIAAHKCWFASKDPAFKPYSFANELNSFSGQPRFLLVPARNFGGKPLLVVQAHAGSSQVSAFGPLMEAELAPRIRSDISRWSSGDGSCGAAA